VRDESLHAAASGVRITITTIITTTTMPCACCMLLGASSCSRMSPASAASCVLHRIRLLL